MYEFNYMRFMLFAIYSILTSSFTTTFLPLKKSFNTPCITKLRMSNMNSIQNNLRNSTNNINALTEPLFSLNNDVPLLKMSNNITDVDEMNIINNITVNNVVSEENERKYSRGCIKKTNFDKLFLNIFNIKKVYYSANNDRIIVCYDDDNKNVYYINNEEEKNKINHLISLINKSIKIIIISDYYNVMDTQYGFLYCEKNDD